MMRLVKSYLGLCKLKVVALIVFTAMVGMFLATSPPGMVPWDVLLFGNLGIGLAAASAAALGAAAGAARGVPLLLADTRDGAVGDRHDRRLQRSSGQQPRSQEHCGVKRFFHELDSL